MLHLNLELFILLQFTLVFDWLIQTDYQAIHKFENVLVRCKHALIYTTCSLIFLSLFSYPAYVVFSIGIILFVSHEIIDSRKPVIWWMIHIKRIPKENVKDLWWLNIAIDQIFHSIVNFVIAVAV